MVGTQCWHRLVDVGRSGQAGEPDKRTEAVVAAGPMRAHGPLHAATAFRWGNSPTHPRKRLQMGRQSLEVSGFTTASP